MNKEQQEFIAKYELKEDIIPLVNSDGNGIDKLIGWSKSIHSLPYHGRLSVNFDFDKFVIQIWNISTYTGSTQLFRFVTSNQQLFEKFMEDIGNDYIKLI